MNIQDIIDHLNIEVVESTISGENFISTNLYSPNSVMHHNVLYYPMNQNQINDTSHSFLFINELPSGNYKKYILIKTEEEPLYFLSKIQNEIILNHNFTNNMARLANIGYGKESLENILKLAANIGNNPFVLCNTSYEVIYMTDNNLTVKDLSWPHIAKYGIITNEQVNYFENSSITRKVQVGPEPVLWDYENPDSSSKPKLTYRVMGEKGVIGYTTFYIENADTLPQCIEILKQLSTILSSFMDDSSKRITTKNQLRKMFLKHLIEGEFHSEENLDFQLKHIDFHKQRHYRLILVSYETDSPIYNIDYYLSIIMNPNIIGYRYHGKILLLVGYEDNFHSLINSLKEVMQDSHFTYLVSPEFYNLMHAEDIIGMLNSYYQKENTIHYVDDYLHIKHVPAMHLYNSTYEALSNCQNGMELIKTLAVYIENNMNITDCAKALFIHRNTTMYRLERIREEGRIDLNNCLELINFYIYYCIKNDLL